MYSKEFWLMYFSKFGMKKKRKKLSLFLKLISRFRDKATLPTAKSVMKEDTPESATAATISKDAVLNKEVVADETSKDDKAAV